MKLRSLLAAALAGAVLLTAAPAGAAPAPIHRGSSAAALAAALPAALPAAIPAGSYLAVVESGPDGQFGSLDVRSQRLVLVSPTGETRTIYTFKVKNFRALSLADWSVDAATALLVTPERQGSQLIKVDVATGATQVLDVPRLNNAILDPAGTGVLATSWKRRSSNTLVLDRISWSGTTTRLREGVNGLTIAGRNGTVLTSDVAHGRVQRLLSTADGSVVHQFRRDAYCSPIRWWDSTRLLEMCGSPANLFLVDPATGSADQLTSAHGQGDYGHLDGRYVDSSLYVQVGGACGYTYVAKVTRHATKPVKVPGAVGNVIMVDTVGSDLVLVHAASCDGGRPRSVLSLFDPVHHDETPLLKLGRHEAFGRIMVLGEVRASAF
jgi:hypothetical protein